MLKKRIMTTFIGALVLGMMTSSFAFADTNSVMPINLTEEDYAQLEELAQADYIAKEGIVSSITQNNDYYTIEVKASEGNAIDTIYNVPAGTYTFNQESNEVTSIEDIKEGMKIAAVLSKNAPMTMSLPAQCSDVTAFVIMNDGFINVSQFNNELINAENTLQLNIADETKILNSNGIKMILKAEDIKNQNCIVLYTSTTRSIPAQTAPETVIILENLDEAFAENSSSDDIMLLNDEASARAKTDEDKYVELRSEAEAKGYKIEWAGSSKPIALTKDDMRIEITIGSTAFSFTHLTRDIKALDRVEKLSMPVTLENGKTMVAKSFIDALE